MTRKPLNQAEFLSALDFVKTDVDNLRAYFEQGAIQQTPAVVERALRLRVAIEMLVGLFGSSTARDSSFNSVFDNLTLQNKAIARQNAEILQHLGNSEQSQNMAVLNEVLNVKEMLKKAGLGVGESGEVANLKNYIANSLLDIEQRITKNIQYSQQSQLQELSTNIVSEISYRNRFASNQSGENSEELIREIVDFREECNKKLALMEQNLMENISQSKDEVIYSQRSDEILNIAKENKINLEKSIVYATTNMQVLRGLSKQIMGIYEAEKRALADIEKSIAGVGNHAKTDIADTKLSEGFAQLKEELQSISSIINFGEIDEIKDTNEALEIVDSYANAQFEPEGLLQTAKELENLAMELAELEKSQKQGLQESMKEAEIEEAEIEENQTSQEPQALAKSTAQAEIESQLDQLEEEIQDEIAPLKSTSNPSIQDSDEEDDDIDDMIEELVKLDELAEAEELAQLQKLEGEQPEEPKESLED
ncbi:MAG: hypothetical protein R3Y32_07480 [Bacillota bacterium]